MIPSSKSLIKIKNNCAPRTDPCGMPLNTSAHLELHPSEQILVSNSSSVSIIKPTSLRFYACLSFLWKGKKQKLLCVVVLPINHVYKHNFPPRKSCNAWPLIWRNFLSHPTCRSDMLDGIIRWQDRSCTAVSLHFHCGSLIYRPTHIGLYRNHVTLLMIDRPFSAAHAAFRHSQHLTPTSLMYDRHLTPAWLHDSRPPIPQQQLQRLRNTIARA